MTDIRVLGIYLEPSKRDSTRVGTLVADAYTTRILIDDAYVALGPQRPIFSAAFYAPSDETNTLRRLQEQAGRVSRAAHLPPCLGHLLPEGALREIILGQLEPSLRDEFALLERLGEDLPGALVARRETVNTRRPAESAPQPPPRAPELPRLKFSLAGVQLKFSMIRDRDKLTMPASGAGGQVIAKVAAREWPFLCESELLGMRLAEAVGVNTARCDLVPVHLVEGLHRELPGAYVLAVDRFDRRGSDRLHTEELASILGLPPGAAKYSLNVETVLRLISKFSSKPREDTLEAVRRITVDLLLGNGDSHLKNWAFTYGEDGRTPQLSPAYDIVPTVLHVPDDDLALKLSGTKSFAKVSRSKLARLARVADLAEAEVLDEVDQVIQRAMDTWPGIVRHVPLPKSLTELLHRRWRELDLVGHLPSAFVLDPSELPALVCGERRIATVTDARVWRPNASLDSIVTFSVPLESEVDLAKPHHLQYAHAAPLALDLRKVRPSKGRTRVVARVRRSSGAAGQPPR